MQRFMFYVDDELGLKIKRYCKTNAVTYTAFFKEAALALLSKVEKASRRTETIKTKEGA